MKKAIKCLACKSRTISIKQNIDRNKIKLNVVNIDGSTFAVIGETTKIQTLLQQCNQEELFDLDLIENEQVLTLLSTLHVRVIISFKYKDDFYRITRKKSVLLMPGILISNMISLGFICPFFSPR